MDDATDHERWQRWVIACREAVLDEGSRPPRPPLSTFHQEEIERARERHPSMV